MQALALSTLTHCRSNVLDDNLAMPKPAFHAAQFPSSLGLAVNSGQISCAPPEKFWDLASLIVIASNGHQLQLQGPPYLTLQLKAYSLPNMK